MPVSSLNRLSNRAGKLMDKKIPQKMGDTVGFGKQLDLKTSIACQEQQCVQIFYEKVSFGELILY